MLKVREHFSSTDAIFTRHLVLFQVLKKSLICASLVSGAQLRTIYYALIPRMAIFGVRLLLSKKFVMLVNERSRGLSKESTILFLARTVL